MKSKYAINTLPVAEFVLQDVGAIGVWLCDSKRDAIKLRDQITSCADRYKQRISSHKHAVIIDDKVKYILVAELVEY